MNKLTKLLSIFAISATIGTGVVGLVGCDGCNDTDGHQHNYTWVDNGDGTHKEHCDVDGCNEPDRNEGSHTFDENGNCVCGAVQVTHNYGSEWKYDFDNHYKECTDEGCTDPKGEVAKHTFDSNGICTTCGAKFATYEFVPSNLEAKNYSDDYVSGIFTILGGTTVRTRSRENYSVYDYANGEGDSTGTPVATGFTASKSVQYDGQNKGISVNAIAPGRLTIYIDNGSGGKTKQDRQTILLTKPDGSTEVISYYCGDMYAVTIDCDTIGTYKITRGSAPGVGTTDLYYAKFETVVAVTPVESIQVVDGGKVDYIKGEEFDSSTLQVQIVRKTTGTIEPLDLKAEGVSIDYSKFNKDVPGEYTITVSYTVDGETFKDDYTVTVYGVLNLELGFNGIVQGPNSSAGNGQYINKTVKQFYFIDEDFKTDGLTVKTVLDEEGTQKKIVDEGFTITGFEKGKAGKQTITVSWTETPAIKQTFDVYVAAYTASSITANQEITVSVNSDLDDAQVGVRSGGVYQFKTIQQSLDFLNALNLDKNVKKVINLAEGTYTERLEITIPNLVIRGADINSPENTVIEWDSLVGIEDESGFVHITDSTATLNVRDTAVGFVIEGVTISNWYNSEEHFTEKFGAGYNEHRALAMLIQADKVVVDNCRLLGYQDTIELFTGRQLISNTYICGRTDFIFGTNNTTYFKDCTIESIVDGGYVTAFKGNNKGDTDWVQYGAIFDGCDFIAPENVIEKANTSLGRTWGKYAAVAYINCDFAGHISTKPYGSGSGTRYTSMSGAEPTDATVKFVEYNNTGDGAVDSTVAGMTYLTAEQAEKYSDIAVIFGTVNGKVTYADAWDGEKGVEITIIEYRFSDYYTADDGMTYHNIPEGGEAFMGDLATVKGTKWGHELNQSKDQAKFDDGTVIEFNVAGKVTVTTYGSSYGLPENININYVNGKAVLTISATADSPLTNGCYITLIQIDTKDVPEDTKYEITFNSLGGSDIDTVEVLAFGKVTAPEDPVYNGYTFMGWYVDEDCLVAYDFDTEITEDITLYAKWKSNSLETYTVSVKVWGIDFGTVDVTEGDTLDVEKVEAILQAKGYENYTAELFTDEDLTAPFDGSVSGDMDVYAGIITTKNVTYTYAVNTDGNSAYFNFTDCDFTNGSWLTYNADSEIKIYVTAGTIITFGRSPYETNTTVKVNGVVMPACATDNTIVEVSYTATENGIVSITADGTAYLRTITVKPAIKLDIGDSVNLTGSKLNLTAGQSGEFEGLNITAGTDKFQDNTTYFHVGAGAIITFNVADGVTVDNMQVLLVEYQGDETKYNNYFTYDIEGGVCTVTVGSSTLYIKEIKLVAKS